MSVNYVHAKCGKCGHRWPALRLPMELGKVGKLMRRAFCPECGAESKDIFVGEKEAKA
jgi:ribosomal protein S27AE